MDCFDYCRSEKGSKKNQFFKLFPMTDVRTMKTMKGVSIQSA